MLTIIMAVMLAAPAVYAGKIFLNDMDITGVKNKSFKKVKEVKITANGDIYLIAPQYEVKVMETGGKTSQTATSNTNSAALAGQYFMATQGAGKKAQYQLVITINGIQRLIIDPSSSSKIEEITGWLKKGSNTVTVTARKQLGSGRISTSKDDKLTLMIGKGHEDKKVVKIDKLMATFKCDASKLTDITRTYTITAN